MVNSIACSSGGPGFISQHAHGSSQTFIALVAGRLMSLSEHQTCNKCTDMHAGKIHIHIKFLLVFLRETSVSQFVEHRPMLSLLLTDLTENYAATSRCTSVLPQDSLSYNLYSEDPLCPLKGPAMNLPLPWWLKDLKMPINPATKIVP